MTYMNIRMKWFRLIFVILLVFLFSGFILHNKEVFCFGFFSACFLFLMDAILFPKDIEKSWKNNENILNLLNNSTFEDFFIIRDRANYLENSFHLKLLKEYNKKLYKKELPNYIIKISLESFYRNESKLKRLKEYNLFKQKIESQNRIEK